MGSIPETQNYLSISRAALEIDISVVTIKRWYKWWESDQFEKPDDLYLPPYQYMDRRKTKYFKKDDIVKLKAFNIALQTTHRGAMSEFNAAYQWGKRGGRALTNKGLDAKTTQSKIR